MITGVFSYPGLSFLTRLRIVYTQGTLEFLELVFLLILKWSSLGCLVVFSGVDVEAPLLKTREEECILGLAAVHSCPSCAGQALLVGSLC